MHYALGIVTPASPALTSRELVHQLKDASAKAIVCHASVLAQAVEAAKEAGLPLDRIFVFGKKRIGNHLSWRDILTSREAAAPGDRIDPKQDLAFLSYSSGTTGMPKGVMLTHNNIIANVYQAQAIDFSHLFWDRDVVLGLLPFYHIYGLTILVTLCIFNGLTVIVHEKFDMEKLLKSIQKHKITMLYTAPPVILKLAKDKIVDDYDVSSVRMIVSGAAPLTNELQIEARKRLNVPVKQAYGMSELSPIATMGDWETAMTLNGSAGLLIPNMIAKFVDEDYKTITPGKTGELCLKGPNVMKGYLNNVKATKETIMSDGFLRTGDVGHVDKDGNFFITDRAKELIKTSGFQV